MKKNLCIKLICLSLAMVMMVSSCVLTANASVDEVALDDNVYNLVTSINGNASTSRGFAWTAVDG